MMRMRLLACFVVVFMQAAPVFAAGGAFVSCPMPQTAPIVNVTWTVMPLVMDYSKTFRELRAQGVPTIQVPGYTGENALTEGLTVAQIRFGGGGSQLLIQQSPDRSNTCFSYARIDMHINVNPTIHIAREVARGTCHAQAVLNHEMQHYNMVNQLTKRYRDILQSELARFVAESGLRGPYADEQHQVAIHESEERLKTVVSATYDQMLAENQRLQATIDNPDEYRRVANLCR